VLAAGDDPAAVDVEGDKRPGCLRDQRIRPARSAVVEAADLLFARWVRTTRGLLPRAGDEQSARAREIAESLIAPAVAADSAVLDSAEEARGVVDAPALQSTTDSCNAERPAVCDAVTIQGERVEPEFGGETR